MAKVTSQQNKKIREATFKKADSFGYSSSGRIDSGRFMDDLVEDPEIGGVLKQYMDKERVRTYIKDSVLNAYAKKKIKDAFDAVDPTETIEKVYGVKALKIQTGTRKSNKVTVSRAADGHIFVVSGGTVLYWENALRKALELVAKQPGLIIEGRTPSICLTLVSKTNSLTIADTNHITTALKAVGVQAVFLDT
ncbi:MAG: hypothetical protein FWE12_05100 [Oscillospiraceae bacterium]|nr:hypothetical protein [Oscillospiraceae bacterium]